MANELLRTRHEQMFPKLTAPQIARLETHGARMDTHAGEVLVEAGDVRCGSVKRVVAAVGEGSSCVQFVHRALREISEAAQQPAQA